MTDRLPSCFCGDATHRDRWFVLAFLEFGPSFSIHDYCDKVTKPASSILDPIDKVDPKKPRFNARGRGPGPLQVSPPPLTRVFQASYACPVRVEPARAPASSRRRARGARAHTGHFWLARAPDRCGCDPVLTPSDPRLRSASLHRHVYELPYSSNCCCFSEPPSLAFNAPSSTRLPPGRPSPPSGGLSSSKLRVACRPPSRPHFPAFLAGSGRSFHFQRSWRQGIAGAEKCGCRGAQ